MSIQKGIIPSTEEQNGASPQEYEVKEVDEPGLVPARYRGTAHDKKEMSVMGKQQVLRVCEYTPLLVTVLTVVAKFQVRYHGWLRINCDGLVGNLTTVSSSPETLQRLNKDADHYHSSLFTFVLTDGGPALLFWGFIAVASGQLLVYASIAEVASM